MPDEGTPATVEQVEANAEATIAAAAITLETVQAAIEAEGQTAEDRQEELLEEVRKCQASLQALSASMERGAESPSLQQLLIQTGQMQTSLEAIQADLAEWKRKQSRPSSGENADGQEEKSEPPIQPGAQNEGPPPQSKQSETSQSPEENSSPPRSNQSDQSATPSSKKKRYVRI